MTDLLTPRPQSHERMVQLGVPGDILTVSPIPLVNRISNTDYIY